MNRKQSITLLLLVLIVGGAGLAVYKRSASSWEEGGAPPGKVLGDFALNDVARVMIQRGGDVLTLVKAHDVWTVQERDGYPADFQRVGNLIQDLWQLKAVQQIDLGSTQLERLDLLTPAKGAAHTGILVALQNKDARPVATLLIGKYYFKKSPQSSDAEEPPAGRYVMPAGATPPKVYLVSRWLAEANATPEAWLDKTFLQINRIQSVALVSGTGQWKLNRATDTATDWKLADLQPDETLDSAKIPSFAGIFGSPVFSDVLPANPPRDGFDSTVTITTFDGFTYTLRFGKSEGANLPLAIAVSANLPKEHPEALTETLTKAKSFETRVYLVPKAAFEPLWKSRAELLAEKHDPQLPPLPDSLKPTSTPAAAKPARQ